MDGRGADLGHHLAVEVPEPGEQGDQGDERRPPEPLPRLVRPDADGEDGHEPADQKPEDPVGVLDEVAGGPLVAGLEGQVPRPGRPFRIGHPGPEGGHHLAEEQEDGGHDDGGDRPDVQPAGNGAVGWGVHQGA